jgi:putative addiction module component (TIGR02574 family)
MSVETLLKEVKGLPLEQRIEFVQRAWDDLAQEGFDPDLTPEELAELERRAEELRQHPERGIPWEQVKAEIKQRLQDRRA